MVWFRRGFSHTGHNAIEKMHFATGIVRTLKGVQVEHIWRNAHGKPQVGDRDFITTFTFPKWDAE